MTPVDSHTDRAQAQVDSSAANSPAPRAPGFVPTTCTTTLDCPSLNFAMVSPSVGSFGTGTTR